LGNAGVHTSPCAINPFLRDRVGLLCNALSGVLLCGQRARTLARLVRRRLARDLAPFHRACDLAAQGCDGAVEGRVQHLPDTLKRIGFFYVCVSKALGLRYSLSRFAVVDGLSLDMVYRVVTIQCCRSLSHSNRVNKSVKDRKICGGQDCK